MATFTPADIFSDGSRGAWWDPSDLSTLFQDVLGNTPVTAVDQPVALVQDKSGNGNHLFANSGTTKPLLKQNSSGQYYLQFDGVDDTLISGTNTNLSPQTQNLFVCVSCKVTNTSSSGPTLYRYATPGNGIGSYWLNRSSSSIAYSFKVITNTTPTVYGGSDVSVASGTNVLTMVIDRGFQSMSFRRNRSQLDAAPLQSDTSDNLDDNGQFYLGSYNGEAFAIIGVDFYGAVVNFQSDTSNFNYSDVESWLLSNIDVPSITLDSPINGANVGRGNADLSVTVSDARGSIDYVQYKLDGVNYSKVTAAPWSSTLTVVNSTTGVQEITDGDHTLSATVVDAAGNSTSTTPITITVDTVNPVATITNPSNGDYIGGTYTLTATATSSHPISSVQFRKDGENLGAPVTASPYEFAWDTTVESEGSHTISAIATDSIGNEGTATPVTITVDNTAPTVTITDPAPADGIKGSVLFKATASDTSAGVKQVQFSYRVFGETAETDIGSPITSPPYQVTWDTTAVSDAKYDVLATATDNAGNTSTDVYTSTVDNATPLVTITSPDANDFTRQTITLSATVTASDSFVTSVQFYLDGGMVGDPVTSTPYEIDLDTTERTDGVHTVTAIATNIAETTSESTAVNFTIDNTPPTVIITAPTAITGEAYLSWSKDGGRTFSTPIKRSIPLSNLPYTRVLWRRLGMSRDWVFKIQIEGTTKIINIIGAYAHIMDVQERG